MKLVCLFLSLVFSISSLAATSKNVTYKSGDDTVRGIVYTPDGKGPFPALVVIHEWWGLNDWVKEQASRLADEGYVTLAVDLYRGKVATTPDEAHEIMRGVPEDRAARDLQEWARAEAMPSEEEISRLRQLIHRAEADLDALVAAKPAAAHRRDQHRQWVVR